LIHSDRIAETRALAALRDIWQGGLGVILGNKGRTRTTGKSRPAQAVAGAPFPYLEAPCPAPPTAPDLGSGSDGGTEAGSITGTGASIVLVLASSVRVPLAELAISNGLFPGLAGVVKTLASELGPAGIRINGLLPVRIATDRVRELDALRGDPDEVRARLSEHIPLRRYGEPEEFGRAAAFVLSPAASYITGAMIPLDGGAISSI
jgi:hypothetical protein